MKWENELTRQLRITYPIIQAPMLGITTPEMVAAASNTGGLGSLPIGGLSPAKTTELILQTKALTNKPFAVNLFVHDLPSLYDNEAYEAMQNYLEQYATQHGTTFTRQALQDIRFYHYLEQIEILIEHQIPIVSFTFGILNDDSIKKLKEAGIILIGTATSLEEAQLLEQKEIDYIAVQGIEAGGHRGSFLKGALPMIGLMPLLKQLKSVIQTPLIAAGAIADGESVKTALTQDAIAVQIGTLFIPAKESTAAPIYKESIQHAKDTDTELTQSFSGRWARGIKNTFMEDMIKSGLKIPAYPVQNTLTSSLRVYGQQQNNKNLISLWAGQASSKAKVGTTTEILLNLIKDTEKQ